jgi:hypothetical protein
MREGGQRHAPAALTPGQIPGTHCTGGLVDLGADLSGFGKSRFHCDSIHGPPSPYRVAIPVALSRGLLVNYSKAIGRGLHIARGGRGEVIGVRSRHVIQMRKTLVASSCSDHTV